MLPPAALLADYAGLVDVSDRSEVRFRTTNTTSGAAGTAGLTAGVDLYTQPRLHATLGDRRWEYTLEYTPSATLQDLELGIDSNTFQLLQVGRVAASWHDTYTRITASEDASYGTINSSNLQVTTTAPAAGTMVPPGSTTLLTLPQPTTITLLSSRTTLSLDERIGRHTSFYVDGGYLRSGGLGSESLSVLPEQYGPRADGYLVHDFSPRDAAVTTAFAFTTDFTHAPCAGVIVPVGEVTPICAPQARVAYLTEGWRHLIERTTTFSLSLGASAGRVRQDTGEPFHVFWYPAGAASVSHRFDGPKGRSSIEFDVFLTPTIDPTTGSLSDFLATQVALLDVMTSVVTTRVTGGVGQSLAPVGPSSSTTVHAELEVDYLVNRQVELALGERGAFQNTEPTGQTLPIGTVSTNFGSFFSTFTYFAVTVRAPALRF